MNTSLLWNDHVNKTRRTQTCLSMSSTCGGAWAAVEGQRAPRSHAPQRLRGAVGAGPVRVRIPQSIVAHGSPVSEERVCASNTPTYYDTPLEPVIVVHNINPLAEHTLPEKGGHVSAQVCLLWLELNSFIIDAAFFGSRCYSPPFCSHEEALEHARSAVYYGQELEEARTQAGAVGTAVRAGEERLSSPGGISGSRRARLATLAISYYNLAVELEYTHRYEACLRW